MRLSRMAIVGVLALAVLSSTGCGIFGGADGASGSGSGSAPAGGTAGGEPEPLGGIIATREIEVEESGRIVPVRVELHQLRRDNGFVTVNLRMTNTGPEGGQRWQVADEFAGETVGHTMAGVSLVDRKNRKQYLVARVDNPGAGQNNQEQYLCSADLAGVFVQPGQSVQLYAVFGAPPDEVRAVDIVVPNVPVFENVPLG
ncbi:hypothetical protein [Plantactinospora sonchi]|uniref:DUF4352 domain-containing protein n=1 Tax=Plantactinospora sonchi TaxID=1544735 RepID=A0ABU7RLW2_9ACTN